MILGYNNLQLRDFPTHEAAMNFADQLVLDNSKEWGHDVNWILHPSGNPLLHRVWYIHGKGKEKKWSQFEKQELGWAPDLKNNGKNALKDISSAMELVGHVKATDVKKENPDFDALQPKIKNLQTVDFGCEVQNNPMATSCPGAASSSISAQWLPHCCEASLVANRTAYGRLNKPYEQLVQLNTKLMIHSKKKAENGGAGDAAADQMSKECDKCKTNLSDFIQQCMSEIAEFEVSKPDDVLFCGIGWLMVDRCRWPTLVCGLPTEGGPHCYVVCLSGLSYSLIPGSLIFVFLFFWTVNFRLSLICQYFLVCNVTKEHCQAKAVLLDGLLSNAKAHETGANASRKRFESFLNIGR